MIIQSFPLTVQFFCCLLLGLLASSNSAYSVPEIQEVCGDNFFWEISYKLDDSVGGYICYYYHCGFAATRAQARECANSAVECRDGRRAFDKIIRVATLKAISQKDSEEVFREAASARAVCNGEHLYKWKIIYDCIPENEHQRDCDATAGNIDSGLSSSIKEAEGDIESVGRFCAKGCRIIIKEASIRQLYPIHSHPHRAKQNGSSRQQPKHEE